MLTPDNCVVTLINHQPQMLFGLTSIDRQTLINNVVGFSKAAKLFDVPTILGTVESKQSAVVSGRNFRLKTSGSPPPAQIAQYGRRLGASLER